MSHLEEQPWFNDLSLADKQRIRKLHDAALRSWAKTRAFFVRILQSRGYLGWGKYWMEDLVAYLVAEHGLSEAEARALSLNEAAAIIVTGLLGPVERLIVLALHEAKAYAPATAVPSDNLGRRIHKSGSTIRNHLASDTMRMLIMSTGGAGSGYFLTPVGRQVADILA